MDEFLSKPEVEVSVEFPPGSLKEEEELCQIRYKRWAPLMSIQGLAGFARTHKFAENLGGLHNNVPNVDVQAIYGE